MNQIEIVLSKKIILTSFLISLMLINYVNSSTFITKITTHPDHPGKCWSEEFQIAVKPGHTADVQDKCIQMFCTKDLRLAGSSCSSAMTLDSNCHEIDGDLSQPYPFCCPRFRCVDEQGDNFIFK